MGVARLAAVDRDEIYVMARRSNAPLRGAASHAIFWHLARVHFRLLPSM